MRAKGYFEKYEARLTSADKVDAAKAVMDILGEMSKEIETIVEVRGVKRGAAFDTMILEQNDRWNSLSSRLENKYGYSPLEKDGFKNFWYEQIPELLLIEKGILP